MSETPRGFGSLFARMLAVELACAFLVCQIVMNFDNIRRHGWDFVFRVGDGTEPWTWKDLLLQPSWVPAGATVVFAIAIAASVMRFRRWGPVWWVCVLLPVALISMSLTWAIPFHFD
jgi:hypothetical protein